jgi:putative tricarboxylic transport membrane protein
MQLSDRVTGSFLVALGGACAYGGWLLPPVPGQQIGPDVFPLVIGIGLMICGAMIALGIGHSFEEEERLEPDPDKPAGMGDTAPPVRAFSVPIESERGSSSMFNRIFSTQTGSHFAGKCSSWARGLLALVPPGLLLFYVLAVDRLGFALTAAAMVLTAAIALGARLRLAIPLAIGAPIFVHLVFSKLLRVPLPAGLLPMPW